MTAITIRTATRGDVPQIVALLADDVLGSTRERLTDPLDRAYYAAFEAIEAAPNEQLLVAERAGQLAGCLQLTFLPGLSHRGAWRGQIEGVRVAAPLRGGGIGRQMLLAAIELCRARGCLTVQLTTNASRTEAQRFYISLGFQASHIGMKLILE